MEWFVESRFLFLISRGVGLTGLAVKVRHGHLAHENHANQHSPTVAFTGERVADEWGANSRGWTR